MSDVIDMQSTSIKRGPGVACTWPHPDQMDEPAKFGDCMSEAGQIRPSVSRCLCGLEFAVGHNSWCHTGVSRQEDAEYNAKSKELVGAVLTLYFLGALYLSTRGTGFPTGHTGLQLSASGIEEWRPAQMRRLFAVTAQDTGRAREEDNTSNQEEIQFELRLDS